MALLSGQDGFAHWKLRSLAQLEKQTNVKESLSLGNKFVRQEKEFAKNLQSSQKMVGSNEYKRGNGNF